MAQRTRPARATRRPGGREGRPVEAASTQEQPAVEDVSVEAPAVNPEAVTPAPEGTQTSGTEA